MNNSMLLVTSAWGNFKTFKLIPISKDCPYNECIFDVKAKVLAVISKESKQSLHMLPKLNDQGDVQYLKIGKKSNGKDYAEERKLLDTFYEYYIEETPEVENFIKMFAINAESFDYTKYIDFEMPKEEIKENAIVTSLV
jgi:hypothetical protein